MRIQKMIKKAARSAAAAAAPGRLQELAGVKDNPGALRALCYVPDGLEAGAPLVVVLHGCTQNAADYDRHSGWSQLADRHGFALLFPEQQRANNPGLCFNWFTANDSQRGMGEAASIRSMVEAMRKAHGLDPARTFVTGLSAGGAMAAVMLAAYPDTFAAGAIIAGVAYGCASGVSQAFDCMGGRARLDADTLAASVRRASPHKGPWPRVSVWQGGADTTVVPSNADALVRQWTALHGLPPAPDRIETVAGYPRSVWTGGGGEVLVEHYAITGMAHGTPLAPGTGEGQAGVAGAHMLDVGLSSTDRILAFFGIAPAVEVPRLERKSAMRAAPRRPQTKAEPQRSQVQAVIEDALRAAGLMR